MIYVHDSGLPIEALLGNNVVLRKEQPGENFRVYEAPTCCRHKNIEGS